MSHPEVLVRVARHADASVRYIDDTGAAVEWRDVGTAVAELLQHECDHLDGVLAFDRAVGGRGAVVHRDVYARDKARLDASVDYRIVPTV